MINKVFLSSAFRGWVLEGIVKESAKSVGNKITIIYVPNRTIDYFRVPNLIKYLTYRKTKQPILIVNQNTFFKLFNDKKLKARKGGIRIFFTHSTNFEEFCDYYRTFSASIEKILVMNNFDRLRLIESGITSQKVLTIYGAIDSNIYYPLTKTQDLEFKVDPFVLVVGDCKPRKNPHRIYEVITYMANTTFIIHGRGWISYFSNNSLNIPNNAKFKDFNLVDNPTLMRRASAYLSLASLEGGPYTTLESLASGTPVVATNTGWNAEFISNANGYLIENDSTITDIASNIRKAMRLKKKCFTKSLLPSYLNWNNLGEKIYKL
jgi:glycosyltransferase involved in cell wall biosynthesis